MIFSKRFFVCLLAIIIFISCTNHNTESEVIKKYDTIDDGNGHIYIGKIIDTEYYNVGSCYNGLWREEMWSKRDSLMVSLDYKIKHDKWIKDDVYNLAYYFSCLIDNLGSDGAFTAPNWDISEYKAKLNSIVKASKDNITMQDDLSKEITKYLESISKK